MLPPEIRFSLSNGKMRSFDDFIKLICFFTINARKRRTTTTSKTLRER